VEEWRDYQSEVENIGRDGNNSSLSTVD
jgi:hypothetical protein